MNHELVQAKLSEAREALDCPGATTRAALVELVNALTPRHAPRPVTWDSEGDAWCPWEDCRSTEFQQVDLVPEIWPAELSRDSETGKTDCHVDTTCSGELALDGRTAADANGGFECASCCRPVIVDGDVD